MMSTNTMSGWWSAILASASKPSMAVNTSQPSLARRVSAVRRIVLLSSITSTLRPWSFELALGVLTYRHTPCYARHVTFSKASDDEGTLRRLGSDITCSAWVWGTRNED